MTNKEVHLSKTQTMSPYCEPVWCTIARVGSPYFPGSLQTVATVFRTQLETGFVNKDYTSARKQQNITLVTLGIMESDLMVYRRKTRINALSKSKLYYFVSEKSCRTDVCGRHGG
ncbi:hypothetical protein TNCV_3452971 [Trichonephila clavipes]|nr:hypothetical protein TNCV_3452971 [Trichonephila clavipes]